MALVYIKPFKRIGKTFSTHEAAKAWADEKERELRARRDGNILALPRFKLEGMSGVYFLIKDGICVYVGSSENIHARVIEHRKSEGKTSDFDEYAFVPCQIETMRDMERKYIREWEPIHNYNHVSADERMRRKTGHYR